MAFLIRDYVHAVEAAIGQLHGQPTAWQWEVVVDGAEDRPVFVEVSLTEPIVTGETSLRIGRETLGVVTVSRRHGRSHLKVREVDYNYHIQCSSTRHRRPFILRFEVDHINYPKDHVRIHPEDTTLDAFPMNSYITMLLLEPIQGGLDPIDSPDVANLILTQGRRQLHV